MKTLGTQSVPSQLAHVTHTYVFINDVMYQGLCTKKGMYQKSWAHLISVVVCGLRESLVD